MNLMSILNSVVQQIEEILGEKVIQVTGEFDPMDEVEDAVHKVVFELESEREIPFFIVIENTRTGECDVSVLSFIKKPIAH